MGVLNVTPDSFSDGGHYFECGRAAEHALQMLEDGADIIDIGGESTRPGVTVLGARLDQGQANPAAVSEAAVSEEEELRRVLPVLQAVLRASPDAVMSVDTYKSGVAREVVAHGAEIVNDVSGLQWDREMVRTCAQLKCGLVLMHTRGRPDEWRELHPEPNSVELVANDLASRLHLAVDGGVERERIVIDPGFGFGKNFKENYPLLAHLDCLQRLGVPLMAGTSRKGFIGKTIGERKAGSEVSASDVPVDERLYGSLAAMVISILRGAHVVRVHDVRPAVEAAAIADEVLAAEGLI